MLKLTLSCQRKAAVPQIQSTFFLSEAVDADPEATALTDREFRAQDAMSFGFAAASFVAVGLKKAARKKTSAPRTRDEAFAFVRSCPEKFRLLWEEFRADPELAQMAVRYNVTNLCHVPAAQREAPECKAYVAKRWPNVRRGPELSADARRLRPSADGMPPARAGTSHYRASEK